VGARFPRGRRARRAAGTACFERTSRGVSRPVSHVNVVCVPEKNPFSGTGTTTDSDGEEGVETAADGSEASSIAGNGAGDNNLATIEPIEPIEGAEPSSRSWRGPSSAISRTPDHAPAIESAYALTTGPTIPCSVAATASRRCRSVANRGRRTTTCATELLHRMLDKSRNRDLHFRPDT